MQFQFEAMDANGQEIRDCIEADSQEDAQSRIRQKGYFVTKISRKRGKEEKSEDDGWRIKFGTLFHYGLFWGFCFYKEQVQHDAIKCSIVEHMLIAPIPGFVVDLYRRV